MKSVNVLDICEQLESLAATGPRLNFLLQARVLRQTSRLLRVLPSNTAVGNAVLYVESCFTVYFGTQGAQFTNSQLRDLVQSSLDALRQSLS